MYKLQIDDYFNSSQDQFSVYTSNPEDNDREHCHEFDELVMVEQGHGLHILNGKPSFIQEGDVFYIRSGDFHFYDELGTLKLNNILINRTTDFKYLKNIDSIISQLQKHNSSQPGWISPEHRAHIMSSAKNLYCEDIIYHSRELAKAYQESLFLQLIMSISHSTQQISKSHKKYRTHQLIEWLQYNCLEEIDWSETEAKFLLTRRTIFRQIRETTGMTPDGLIKRLRLVSARAKIRDSDDSITMIAFDCGFTNSNHFSTCYKEAFGISPSQERACRQVMMNSHKNV